jgi:hypothetical protein
MARPKLRESARHEPLFDIHPLTGASIEVFYSDRRLATFGRCGAGWFCQLRRRGFAPGGPPTGPFATSYAAYRSAMNAFIADNFLTDAASLADLQWLCGHIADTSNS